MVLALAGDSTTTTSDIASLDGAVRTRRSGSSATRFPGRSRSRPASSSSSSAAMTAAAENWQRRTRSSTAVGEGPSRSITCRRACAESPGASGGFIPGPGGSAMSGAGPRANSGSAANPSRSGWSGRLSSTSARVSVRCAPWRIRSLAPRERGSSGEPGTANSSRPASWASRAVIRLPERSAASTTTTPSAGRR